MKLNRFTIRTGALFTAMTLSSLAHAGPSLDEFYKLFKSGQYPKALEAIKSIQVSEDVRSSKSYLTGLTYSCMQEYDKAISQFELAIREKNDIADLYYEYGQALFAANELKKARDAFKNSANKKFNRPASLYYIAHISQILEEYELSKDYFSMVIKEKGTDQKLKQVAYFQLGEVLLLLARQKSSNPKDLTRRVDKFILPTMSLALKQNEESEIAKDIRQRTSEIMIEFNLDPNLLANGRRVPGKRYAGYISQKISYDNNITLTSEENNVQGSQKSSLVYETEGYAKYDFIFKKRFMVSPEARFIFTEHGNQSDSDVYQNDALTINGSVKNRYEHLFKELPAATLFDIDYSHTLKDWKAEKKREFYSRSVTFSIGESLSYFNFGDTSVRLKRKNYTGEDETINNHTTTLAADQTIVLPIQHLMVAAFEASFIDNYNSESTSTNTFLLRLDYIIPDIKPKYTLNIALATTMTDTKEQKSTRGTEFTWNPSVDLTYDLNHRMNLGLNYDFTKNTSDSESYAYSKHVITTEFRYAF